MGAISRRAVRAYRYRRGTVPKGAQVSTELADLMKEHFPPNWWSNQDGIRFIARELEVTPRTVERWLSGHRRMAPGYMKLLKSILEGK